MKHDLPAFLVNEKKEPKCSKFYCVAIAGAAVTVAGTAAAVGMQAKQASDQKKAMAAGSAADKHGSRPDLPDFKSHADLPGYDPVRGAWDLAYMQQPANITANSVTKAGINLRERVMPGLKGIMSLAGTNLTALGSGQVAEDEVNNVNQIIAERTGGSYDPSNPSVAGGGRAYSVANFSTGIGRTSQQNVDKFLSSAPNFAQLAGSFAYTPDKAVASAMDLLNSKYNYLLGKAKVQTDIDESVYNSGVNQARAAAGADPQVVGQRNDELAMQALNGQANQAAIKGATSSLQGLVGMFAKTGSTSTLPSYATVGQMGAAAPYAAGYSNISGPGPVTGYVPRAGLT